MEKLFRFGGALVGLALSAAVAWLMWGPLLHWMWRQLPQNEWAGILKIGCAIAVGWLGGIALPLVLFCFAMYWVVSF